MLGEKESTVHWVKSNSNTVDWSLMEKNCLFIFTTTQYKGILNWSDFFKAKKPSF